VLAVVELDDRSHDSKRRRKADADKARAIADAGLRLARWNVQAMPSTAEIFAAIADAAGSDGGVGTSAARSASLVKEAITSTGRIDYDDFHL